VNLLYNDLFVAAHQRSRKQVRPTHYFKIWDDFTHGWIGELKIPSEIEQYLGADLGSVLDEVFEEFESSPERLNYLVDHIQTMTNPRVAEQYLSNCEVKAVINFDLLELSRLLVALTTVNGVNYYQKSQPDAKVWLRQWKRQCYLHNLKHKMITDLIQQKTFRALAGHATSKDIIRYHTHIYQESNSLSMAAAAFAPFASYGDLSQKAILEQLVRVTRWFNPLYRLLSDIPFDITEPMNIGFLIYITEETQTTQHLMTIETAKQRLALDLERQNDLNQKQAQYAVRLVKHLQKRIKLQNDPLIIQMGLIFLDYADKHLKHHLSQFS
jgi:hypothetical protein